MKRCGCVPIRKFTGRSTEAHDGRDLLARRDAGCIEDIRAGLLVGLQALDRVLQVRDADEVILCARREHEGDCPLRLHCSADAVGGEADVVDLLARAIDGILDRAARDAGRGRETDRLRDGLRVVAEAVLEVGIHGKVRRRDDLGDVREHPVAADAVVLHTGGERIARARRRERLESDLREHAGRADVPGIGNDESLRTRVQRAEGFGFLDLRFHEVRP